MTRNVKRLGAFAGALMASAAWGGGALAQEASALPEDADVVRVEGQRVNAGVTALAVDLAQYGTQVQLISDLEIETGGFTNFGELAAGLIRGANVGYSPDEGEFTIRIDGGTDRDTLLMVDGVPYFDRSSPLEDLWPATAIDPRMIESVEIYRGGQSLYFGSNGGLGVVSVRTKEPDGTEKGELGFYAGSFKTREIYGNYSFALDDAGKHSVLFYGRSYETDAHTIFDQEAYGDTVLATGGFHQFPYAFNSLGAKYLFQINDVTEFRAGMSFTNVDFEDSFPESTVYTPNYTEFPIYNASFKTEFSEKFMFELEGHYQDPRLRNHELNPQICGIPRFQDLPANVRTIAQSRGISSFPTAASYEAFAATIPNLPMGCVTDPNFPANRADVASRQSFYFNPVTGKPYGTLDNPFPIGAPMGYVVETVANFGTNQPVKGFGSVDQFLSGYIDYGVNARGTYTLNDYIEVVGGVQYTAYEDNSDPAYGVRDVNLTSTGVYGDLRLSLPILEGLDVSLAGRQDFNTNFEDQTVYKFGARQNLPLGTYVRASGGTSYSLPKIDEIGAYGAASNINPGLEPQEVDAMNYGVGVDGDLMGGGTFNVELGYFETEITNLFADRAVRDVCYEYVRDPANPDSINRPNDRSIIDSNRALIIPPDSFCATAASMGLPGTSSVAVNTKNTQDIQGFTIDVAVDFEQIQADFSFTDMESLEPNPVYGVLARRDHTATNLSFVTPGPAGSEAFRQSAERPEWTLSSLITYTPTDRWIFSINPRWQGPEWAWAPTNAARLVDDNNERVVEDINFGDYFVLNGSVQYLMGDEHQHRFLLRAVNILEEGYYERYSGGSTLNFNTAAVRGEMGANDSNFYRQYGWNGKPRSFWVQYEYTF